MSEKPELNGLVEACDWKSYLYFLNGIGLVENIDGIYKLSKAGQAFWQDPDTRKLADLIQNKYLLFVEVLEFIYQRPVTIQELDRELCELYQLDWKNISNTRKRINWLEVLGLVQALGQKKWGVTDAGKKALKEWYIIDSEVLKENEAFMTELQIKTPPKEIELLLQELQKSPELHKKRCTYNIFVPSPNRIENLEKIIQFSLERVSKQKLFAYLENEFNLKSSSARSMLPFLNAAGLLEETEREVYKATPRGNGLGKKWG